jgi:hypothetical protein
VERHVPLERVVEPSPEVGAQVLFGVRLAGEVSELRDMFARLLTSAMDSQTAANVHPAFAEIIRQMTRDEARIAKALVRHGRLPALTVLGRTGNGGAMPYYRHFSLLCYLAHCEAPDRFTAYVENLSRLGVLEVHHSPGYFTEPSYQKLIEHPQIRPYRTGACYRVRRALRHRAGADQHRALKALGRGSA